MSKPKARPAQPATKKTAKLARTAAALATRKQTRGLVQAAKGASAADHERAEGLLAQIARRKQRIAEEFYDIGEALRDLQKKKLFAALGYKSFAAMLDARKVMSLSQAHKLIRIVESLPREKALAVGSEKAALLIGYADATAEPDTPEWLLDTAKLPNGKPVADASTREIVEATKKARSPRAKKPATPEETKARAAARAAQSALRKRGAHGATVEAVRKGGVWWLRAEVPADAADLLSK